MPVKEVTKGFFWHIHHEKLLEWSENINMRIDYIKHEKPSHEIPIRLRLLKPVREGLPKDLLEAGEAFSMAHSEYEEADMAYSEARDEYHQSASTVKERASLDAKYRKARRLLDEKITVCNDAGVALDEKLEVHKKEILQIHSKQCPGCPWDGKTIFPEQ